MVDTSTAPPFSLLQNRLTKRMDSLPLSQPSASRKKIYPNSYHGVLGLDHPLDLWV